ncbi:MAG: TIGR03619 family F420-dependent LLM class oxidoreductase [Pseudomonadales bacterium]|nr:TIGR03619 family F420-dependent LLM class oxidoreductase [Pseudomonadales bacterium]
MKIGAAMAFGAHTSPEFIRDSVQLVEEKGIDSIWLPEHVLFFPDYGSEYPYSDTGRIPGDPEGILDPFTAMTFIASVTQKVRLGTGICLVPQRQPVYTAKMVADVDFLSGGRVDFGVGIGWLKEEFDNLGMDFSTRAKTCDEYIDAMQALWSPGISEFKGETVNLHPCHFNPKPVQTPHPPIFFGGESGPAMRRVAERGQGWYAYDISPEGLAEKLPVLDEKLAANGRSRDDLTLYVGPNRHPINTDTTQAYAALGVEQIIAPLGARSLDKLALRADALIDSIRG